MKNFLRPHIERILRNLPVSRVAFAERDALASQLHALLPMLSKADADANCFDIIFQMEQYDPRNLEEAVPSARSLEERIEITALCHDADVLPRVANAGAVVRQEDGTDVQIMHNGIRVLAGGYYGAWMQDLITRCKGVHEPQEEVVFAEIMKHLTDGATMVELGGYWSYYSIWFLTEGRGRRAIVVEPDVAHMDVGRANARLNACNPQFVGAFAGGHSSPPLLFNTEKSGEVVLPRVSVPDLMASHSINHLDVLHCDAQGAELDVLEGCLELATTGRLGWVVVSTHASQISGDPLTHQRCLAVLAKSGANILVEHDVHESFSGDGLIVAKFGTVPESWQRPRISYNRYSRSLFRNPLYELASAARAARTSTASETNRAGTAAGGQHGQCRMSDQILDVKLPIPPFEMRQLVGPTEESAFENPSGAPILNVPEERFDSVLDFGCGCGRLARQLLQQRVRPRRYLGFDLHAGMIRWCRENLSPLAPGFTFLHHDVDNPSFNPGKDKPPLLPMPAEDHSFSLLIALSVFTHTVQEHAEYYLREAARVMRPDGELAASFFLFEKRFFPMMQDFQNALYINIDDPWNAVIFDREWLEATLRALGLGVVRAEPPSVRGFQWVLHIRRLSAGEPIIQLPEDHAQFDRVAPPIPARDPSTIGS